MQMRQKHVRLSKLQETKYASKTSSLASNPSRITQTSGVRPSDVLVYFDTEAKKFFYPKRALKKPMELNYNIIRTDNVPLTYDCVTKIYIHPNLLEQYLSFHNPIEFERLHIEQSILPDDISPIYQDPDTNLMYYPDLAFTEPRMRYRSIHKMKPPLKYDAHSLKYFDPKTEELYTQVAGVNEFVRQRQRVLEYKMIPVYYDPILECLFYPQIDRKQIKPPLHLVNVLKAPMYFDPKSKLFYSCENGFFYKPDNENVVVKYLSQFLRAQNKHLLSYDSNTGLYNAITDAKKQKNLQDRILPEFYYNPEQGKFTQYHSPFMPYIPGRGAGVLPLPCCRIDSRCDSRFACAVHSGNPEIL